MTILFSAIYFRYSQNSQFPSSGQLRGTVLYVDELHLLPSVTFGSIRLRAQGATLKRWKKVLLLAALILAG
jgi:hypothetical protein